MPIWGWVCVGLVSVAVGAAVMLAVWLWQRDGVLTANGVDVVAAIMTAHPDLSFAKPRRGAKYRIAQVVFTLDGDASGGHVGVLQDYIEQLRDFAPEMHADRDEVIIGRLLRGELLW